MPDWRLATCAGGREFVGERTGSERMTVGTVSPLHEDMKQFRGHWRFMRVLLCIAR